MKIATVVGARPQFIKQAPVSRALERRGHQEVLIHTGQHYDECMSEVFFRDLSIRKPDVNLNIGSGSHARQTGEMLIGIEDVLVREKPDWLVVFGDTNSTIAGALAAVKLNLPVAHVEAGLRSFTRTMPEEVNRILTDHVSQLLLCPTRAAIDNLRREGITEHVHHIGDVMCDAALQFAEKARARTPKWQELGLAPKGYALATVHRPANTDAPERLAALMGVLEELDVPVVFPVHPRTRKALAGRPSFQATGHVHAIDPVGYLEMLSLIENARVILTDSGGVQKEAYIFGVPCITFREETEWVETVQHGWNVLAGIDRTAILAAMHRRWPAERPPVFGDGHASDRVVELLETTKRQ